MSAIFKEQTRPILAIKETARYIVIDIETGNAPGEAINEALNTWKPPSNIKNPEKIEARRIEAFDKIAERGALLDASPILCIAVKSDQHSLIFDGMGSNAGVDGWMCIHTTSERDMLLSFRIFLDDMTCEDTLIIGHNVRHFDLPKLRHAFLRNRLRLPAILAPKLTENEPANPVCDTAGLFKAYSMEHRGDFIPSLDTLAASLGIERHKHVVSGADVPQLHQSGDYASILIYCAMDTLCTEQGYLLMSGNHTDLS